MARSIDPFVVGRVVGDVLDLFVPSVELTVCFGSKQVSNGCEIKPSMASDRPFVLVDGSSSCLNPRYDLFTLVMTDPDAPSPSEPRLREWLHWQKRGMGSTIGPPQTRNNFSTRQFAAEHDLRLPVAAAYFNSQKEPMSCRRSR
ncbi:hypothetical protein Dimus_035163 [Dionaea muscipula]